MYCTASSAELLNLQQPQPWRSAVRRNTTVSSPEKLPAPGTYVYCVVEGERGRGERGEGRYITTHHGCVLSSWCAIVRIGGQCIMYASTRSMLQQYVFRTVERDFAACCSTLQHPNLQHNATFRSE